MASPVPANAPGEVTMTMVGDIVDTVNFVVDGKPVSIEVGVELDDGDRPILGDGRFYIERPRLRQWWNLWQFWALRPERVADINLACRA